ncbi:MAG: hypothetical protein COB04_18680 [Gammaproteobacteria bacterium]|nr:MAG: hypothetical protein COB04_18680 [Gammaproteobacteria bacterium]
MVAHLRRWWFIFGLVMTSQIVCASGPLVLTDAPIDHVSVRPYLYFFETNERSLEVEQVRQPSWAKQFTHPEGFTPSFGYSNSIYWLRFSMENQNADELDLIFQIEFPLLDEVKVYQYNGEQLVADFRMGDRLPFLSRPIESRHFQMPINLEGYAINDFYLRVESTSPLEVPLYVSATKLHLAYTSLNEWIVGLAYGIALGLGLYNLLLGFSTRDVVYIYYAGFTLSVFGIYSAIDGYSYMFWPNSVTWQQMFHLYTIFMTCIFAIAFSRSFLDSANKNLKSDRFTRFMNFPSIVGLMFIPMMEEKTVALYMSVVALITIGSLFILGVVRLFQGYYVAKIYLVAWSMLLGTALFAIVGSNGLGFSVQEMKPFLRTGWVLELILLSLGLGQRINLIKLVQIESEREAKESAMLAKKAKQKTLEIQIQSNASLEFRVQTRTAELEGVLKELFEANDKLEKLSTEDELTKVKNRRYFEDRYNLEFKRSFREKQPLSILFIDVDYFKKVNDSHGHKAGDECLRKMAQFICQSIGRAGDVVSRYGGEEFVVILPDTPQEGALKVADRIRHKVEVTPVFVGDLKIQITVSIGVCTDVPDNAYDVESLLVGADKALYQAKDNGRNRTQIGMPKNSFIHNSPIH